jgi:hypothetical protein
VKRLVKYPLKAEPLQQKSDEVNNFPVTFPIGFELTNGDSIEVIIVCQPLLHSVHVVKSNLPEHFLVL